MTWSCSPRSSKSRATVSSQRGQVVSIPQLSCITLHSYMLQKLISRRVQTRGPGPPCFRSVSIHRAEALPLERHIENSRSLMTLPQAHSQGGGSTPGEANLEVQRLLPLPRTLQLKQGYYVPPSSPLTLELWRRYFAQGQNQL